MQTSSRISTVMLAVLLFGTAGGALAEIILTTDWDTGFFPDVPGNYSVVVAATNGVSISYILTDAVSVELNSWGSLNALFR